jgi:large repetitive protein
VIVQSLVLAAALSLGRAESFSILGGSGVTAAGPMRVTGNVGAGSGGVTGVTPAVGDILPGADALNDVAAAWDKLGSLCKGDVPCVLPDDILIIRIDHGLTLPDSSIQLPAGFQSSHVFWRVDGDVTLSERSAFVGTLIASGNITVKEGVTVSGRLISRKGAVTLTTDDVNLCCDPIELSSLPNGIVDIEYNATILPAGDTFSLFAGTLPPGLGPLAPSGTLSGVPMTPGSYTFIVLAKDFKGCSSIRTYTIVICDATVIEPPTLPDAVVGSAYSVPITAIGTHVFTTPKLPDGLTMTPASCTPVALLCGTPRTAGHYTFTITATDCDGACSGSRTYALEVACPVITVFPPTLDAGTVGTLYQKLLTASGSLEPYTFSAGPSTPPGVIVDPAGVLTFTPSTKEPYSVTITATDSHGCSGTRHYTIEVGCPIITITPESLPPGTVNVDYTVQLNADPPLGSYTFSPAQPLPWLTLSKAGVLRVKPPAAGNYTFEVTATHEASGCSGTRIYQLAVTAVPPCPTITISPTTLSRGTVSVPYGNKMIFVTGGTPPYVINVTGSIPPGLGFPPPQLNPLTQPPITLSGTPMTSGVYTFTVTATDSQGCSGEQTYTIAIVQPTPPGAIVPALSPWAVALLSIALATIGVLLIRRG